MTKTKFLFAAITMFFMLSKASAQTTWNIDPVHSSITFTITHLAIDEVEGKFKTYAGTIESSKPDFTDAKIDFTIDTKSISTDNDMRDNHLKSDDFFSADKFPQIKFTATSFKKVDDKNYVLEGNLTIRDVTKKVKFNVIYGGTIKDMRGTTRAGFKATTSIKRQDYGISGGNASAAVGDNVDIIVRLEITQAVAK